MNKIYLNNLKRQFLNSQGCKSAGVNYKEFEEYLIQLTELQYEYRELLENLGIDITDSDYVEINKGVVDSIAYRKTNFSIITPYTDDMVSDLKNDIYRLNFLGKDGVPSFRTNSGIIYNLSEVVPTKHTFITENPYNYSYIEGFAGLSSSGYYNTILGMYGIISDKDIPDKIKMYKSVKSSIGDSYKDEIITDCDKYFWILRSNIKVKVKTKSR